MIPNKCEVHNDHVPQIQELILDRLGSPPRREPKLELLSSGEMCFVGLVLFSAYMFMFVGGLLEWIFPGQLWLKPWNMHDPKRPGPLRFIPGPPSSSYGLCNNSIFLGSQNLATKEAPWECAKL